MMFDIAGSDLQKLSTALGSGDKYTTSMLRISAMDTRIMLKPQFLRYKHGHIYETWCNVVNHPYSVEDWTYLFSSNDTD